MSGSSREAQSSTINATVRSLISTAPAKSSPTEMVSTDVVNRLSAAPEYQIADLVGRFFLRACFWVDVLTSWTKKYQAPSFVVTHERSRIAAASLTAVAAPMIVSAPVLSLESKVEAAIPVMKSTGI